MKVSSAESPRPVSPFASPASLASDETEVRAFLGEAIYRLAKCCELVFLAVYMQLALIGFIPVVALSVWLVEPSSPLGELLHDYVGLLVLGLCFTVLLYSAWAIYWLADAMGHKLHSRILISGGALIPLFGMQILAATGEQARVKLRERSLPLGTRGLDWTAVSQMATTELAGGYYEPFRTRGRNQLYNLVFCDDLRLMEWFEADQVGIGWPTLPVEFVEPAAFQRVLDDDSADTRLRLLAAKHLREYGESIEDERVLGVVFEASESRGLYQVAFYADGRLICLHGSTGILHQSPDASPTTAEVQQVILEVDRVRDAFPTFFYKRPPPPPEAEARITLLTPRGNRNAQGSWKDLFQDSSTKIVAQAAVRVTDQMVLHEHQKPSEKP